MCVHQSAVTSGATWSVSPPPIPRGPGGGFSPAGPPAGPGQPFVCRGACWAQLLQESVSSCSLPQCIPHRTDAIFRASESSLAFTRDVLVDCLGSHSDLQGLRSLQSLWSPYCTGGDTVTQRWAWTLPDSAVPSGGFLPHQSVSLSASVHTALCGATLWAGGLAGGPLRPMLPGHSLAWGPIGLFTGQSSDNLAASQRPPAQEGSSVLSQAPELLWAGFSRPEILSGVGGPRHGRLLTGDETRGICGILVSTDVRLSYGISASGLSKGVPRGLSATQALSRPRAVVVRPV